MSARNSDEPNNIDQSQAGTSVARYCAPNVSDGTHISHSVQNNR